MLELAWTVLPSWEYRLIVVPNADWAWATVPLTLKYWLLAATPVTESLLSLRNLVTAATAAEVGS